MNYFVLGAAGVAAYFFRDQIAAALGTASAPAASPDPAAAAATATAAAAVIKPIVVLPTIAVDQADTHHALVAYANAENAAALATSRAGYHQLAANYLLTVSQWNWYRQQTGSMDGLILEGTEAGDNAISADTYLTLRQARGLTS